jgi:hypothetical protein
MEGDTDQMRPLLLLDVNGVLCRKVTRRDAISLPADTIRLLGCDVIPRPGHREFLTHCFTHYSVGIFSSTTERNVTKILDGLLTPEQIASLALRWFRDRTRLDPDYGMEPNIERHETIKLLSDVLDNPILNEQRRYSLRNIILVDDSFLKVRFIDPQENVLIVPTYRGDPEDAELSKLPALLDARFEKIAGRE